MKKQKSELLWQFRFFVITLQALFCYNGGTQTYYLLIFPTELRTRKRNQ